MMSSIWLASMKLVVSRSMLRIATADNLSSFIVFLKYVLMRRRAENDLSAEQDVAGIEARIVAAIL